MINMSFFWSLFSGFFLMLVLEISLIHCLTPFECVTAPNEGSTGPLWTLRGSVRKSGG